MKMLNFKSFLVFTSTIVIGIIAGCGSGGLSSSASIPSNSAVFIDRLTQGIPYNCGGKTGVTDENGSFNVTPGQGCTFNLGNFTFSVSSSVANSGVVTPYSVGKNPQEALSLAYILHAVSDYDSDYSMKINQTLASKLPVINLSDNEININTKLFNAGIMPKPRSMVANDMARFVNADGSLAYTRKDLIALASASYSRRYPAMAQAFHMKEKDFTAYAGTNVVQTNIASQVTINGGVTGNLAPLAKSGSTANSACVGGATITQDSIKNMSLGSVINQSCSTFQISPILNLGALQTANMILNNAASSTSVSTIAVTATQNATSTMSQTSGSGGFSANYIGFQAAATYSQTNKQSATNDSGSTSIAMTYSTNGANVQLQTLSGSTYLDYSSYLNGTALTSAQINQYVNVVNSTYPASDGNVSYISDLNITNNGYISYAQGAVFTQNIQLLGQMETIFAQLQAQYNNPGTSDLAATAYIQAQSVALMTSLKSTINGAINAFYSSAGDSFADTINVANMASGTGAINFSTSSGNREAQYAGTISGGYAGIIGGGQASASASYQNQNGWSNSLAQTNITAQSWPAGVVDVTSWTSTINSMLKSATATLTVPGVTLPAQPTPTTLPQIGAQQVGAPPPNGTFKDYSQWQAYQASLKPSNAVAPTATAQTNAQAIANNGLAQFPPPTFPLIQSVASNASAQSIDLKTLINEIKALRQESALNKSSNTNAKSSIINIATKALNTLIGGVSDSSQSATSNNLVSASATNNNTINVTNMYVNGYTATPYSAVLIQLMPNLTIPTVATATLSNFANTAQLMDDVIEYGTLDTYLNFVSQYSFSGLKGTNIATGYHTAYTNFANDAYLLIQTALATGSDIDPTVFNQTLNNFISQTSSNVDGCSIYANLNNIDAYNYIVKTLMTNPYQAIWKNAPGGYAPIIFNSNYGNTNDNPGLMRVYMPTQIIGGGPQTNPVPYADLWAGYTYADTKFDSPTKDVLQIYQSVNAKYNANVTPWFPVFQYLGNQTPSLIFFQLVGPYQIVYAKGATVAPTCVAYKNGNTLTLPPKTNPTNVINFNSLAPFNSGVDITTVAQSLLGSAQYGFSSYSWSNSLLWPSTITNSAAIRSQFNVLTVYDDYSINNNNWTSANGYMLATANYNNNSSLDVPISYGSQLNIQDASSGTNKNLCTNNFSENIPGFGNMSTGMCGVQNPQGNGTLPPWLLLPINSTTSPLFASSPNAFGYTLNQNSNTYVLSDYFTSGYTNMMAK